MKASTCFVSAVLVAAAVLVLAVLPVKALELVVPAVSLYVAFRGVCWVAEKLAWRL
jgi:hypothetical protein